MEADWIRIGSDNRVVYWDGFAKGSGSRRFSRFKSREDADDFCDQLMIEAQRTVGMKVRRGTTWKDLCQHWTDAHDGRIPEGTMRRRLSAINAWIIPAVGAVEAKDTQLSTLIGVADRLVDADTGSSNFDSVIQTMQVIGTWAAARDGLPRSFFGTDEERRRALKPLRVMVKNSSRKVKEEGTEEGITIAVVPSWEDICSLADAVGDRAGGIAKSRTVGERYGRAVRIAAGTGLRLCELLGLHAADIDLGKGLIKVHKQLDRYTRWDYDLGAPMPTTPPKHESKRSVAAWAKVKDDLQDAIKAADGGPLFPPFNAQRWWADGWGRLLEAAREDANFRWPGHYLRHHYGSVSITAREFGGLGLPPAVVQQSLGHRTLVTTLNTYVHPVTEIGGWVE